jgi:RNA polymerase sigma-70 factor (ECF subfamily)
MIDRFRQGRRPTVDLDDPALVIAEEPRVDALEAQDRDRLVRAALAELPAEQADVIERAYFGDETMRQIAGALEVPEGTVKSRVRLALERLRRIAGAWELVP